MIKITKYGKYLKISGKERTLEKIKINSRYFVDFIIHCRIVSLGMEG